MSDDKKETKVQGVVAEYTSVDTLLAACNRIREAGYEKTDAYTPFAVHGIDQALGIKPTILPWIALGGGLTGTVTALVMQIWMNSINYPYIISGKPYISLPAFMPVAFELTILFASFGAFFGMWALNKLPRFSNPMFTDPRFDRATDDRFFLYVDSKDERYDQAGVEKLLGETECEYVDTVAEDDSCDKVPKFLFVTIAVMAALSIIPLLVVAKMRVTNSPSPRFHIFYDMDFSPAKDAQQMSTLFADGRAMRPDVPGTVARGQLEGDLNFLTGIDMDELARVDAPRAERLVRAHLFPQEKAAGEESDEPEKTEEKADEEPTTEEADPADSPTLEPASGAEASPVEATPPSVMDTTPWLRQNPKTVDVDLLKHGQKYFGIYCSVCHGMNGGGNGLVNRRAKKILAATWIPPSSLHQDTLYADKYPDGKLFNTISHGIRKMPGYAGQIKPGDRWAIVAYVRALQQSQNASINEVPDDLKAVVSDEQAEVKKMLAEQAEAERKKEEERAKKAAG